MTGASLGGSGGNRYYIGGKSGEALVGAGLALDSLEFALNAANEDMKRGELLHARQRAGEVLDEVDEEHLAKYLEDLRKREENAKEKMRRRMERRAAPIRAKASSEAKAAQKKIHHDARMAYLAKRAATGFPAAENATYSIQFRLIGLGMALGMLAVNLLAK